MHLVANIRSTDKFYAAFPLLKDSSISEAAFAQKYAVSSLRAHHHDLVIVRVIKTGATSTEESDGTVRQLAVGEYIISPVVERDSSLSHGSVVPMEGLPVGATVDYICRGGGVGVSPDNPPGQPDPSKVEIVGILQYDDKRVANARDFAIDLQPCDTTKPVIAIVGSKSDCGKTTACADLIQMLNRSGLRVGVAKMAGTARRGELLELAQHGNRWLDTADVGFPTTHCPSMYGQDESLLIRSQAVAAAHSMVQDLSRDNDVIVAEFGGDLLTSCVPEMLAEPARLNLVTLVMAAESATAAIGMESKLHRISPCYQSIPQYVVGPVANLQANRRRVLRETACAGCHDLWNRSNSLASPEQRERSRAQSEALLLKLLAHCGHKDSSASL